MVHGRVGFRQTGFDEDTLVHGEGGRFHRISTLRVGDRVLSRCEVTGNVACKRIAGINKNDEAEVFIIDCQYRSADVRMRAVLADSRIQATVDCIVQGANKGWMAVQDLQPGDELLTHDGESAIVQSVWKDPFKTQTYGLVVEGFHTCFVGLGGVWVRDMGVENRANSSDAEERLSRESMVGSVCCDVDVNSLGLPKPPGCVQTFGACIQPGELGSRLGQAGFDEDTVVLGKFGRSRKIAHLEVGQRILARCGMTGETAYKRILKFHEYESTGCFSIICNFSPAYFEKYGDCANSPIYATGGQLFRVGNRGWIAVQDLQSGDELLTHDGERVTVSRVEKERYETPAYNLEVEDFHTFFVDLCGVWVSGPKTEVREIQENQDNPSDEGSE